jgi:hypothetical protein
MAFSSRIAEAVGRKPNPALNALLFTGSCIRTQVLLQIGRLNELAPERGSAPHRPSPHCRDEIRDDRRGFGLFVSICLFEPARGLPPAFGPPQFRCKGWRP